MIVYYWCFRVDPQHFVARLDELAWVAHQQKLKKQAARQHILTVTHTKTQLALGKGTLSLNMMKHILDSLDFYP